MSPVPTEVSHWAIDMVLFIFTTDELFLLIIIVEITLLHLTLGQCELIDKYGTEYKNVSCEPLTSVISDTLFCFQCGVCILLWLKGRHSRFSTDWSQLCSRLREKNSWIYLLQWRFCCGVGRPVCVCCTLAGSDAQTRTLPVRQCGAGAAR